MIIDNNVNFFPEGELPQGVNICNVPTHFLPIKEVVQFGSADGKPMPITIEGDWAIVQACNMPYELQGTYYADWIILRRAAWGYCPHMVIREAQMGIVAEGTPDLEMVIASLE